MTSINDGWTRYNSEVVAALSASLMMIIVICWLKNLLVISEEFARVHRVGVADGLDQRLQVIILIILQQIKALYSHFHG